MDKAVDCLTGQEIIILSQEWRLKLGLLRDWSRQDRLVCQGCLYFLRPDRHGLVVAPGCPATTHQAAWGAANPGNA